MQIERRESCFVKIAVLPLPMMKFTAIIAAQRSNRLMKSERQTLNEDRSTLGTIALVFAIISCVIMGFALFPLAWAVPMTVSMSRKLKNGQPISVGFKVCTLLFLSNVSGILLLCMPENE